MPACTPATARPKRLSMVARLRGRLGAMAVTTLAAVLVPVPPAIAASAALTQPEGQVILEVTGAIARGNGEGGAVARFDLAMLEALPQRDTVTATPWYEGPQHFKGPLIASLLDAVAAEGTRLRVTAINDFSAELPVAEVLALPVILATRLNGERMPVREKGPLFVIYPFDEVTGLLNETTLNRSVWQVKAIEILP